MTDWISHRGDTSAVSENTERAFRAAIDAGFTHLETDVRATADGELLLSHDPCLARLGAGSHRHRTVASSTRAELARAELRCGQNLLFFDEFLHRFGQYQWILDIKPETAPATIQRLLHYWQKPALAEFFNQRVRFLFWREAHEQLLLARQPAARCMARLPACRQAALASLAGVPALGRIQAKVTYAVPPVFLGRRILTPRLVAHYHQRGARVLGYLPADAMQTAWALAAGVDEILTNHVAHKNANLI